jgi:ATP-dependent helicase HrpA
VTLILNESQLGTMDPVGLEWLVPGMLKEKVQALLKSLPQKIRRECVPLPDYAAGFCERSAQQAGQQSLIQALIRDISQETGVTARRDDFKLDAISPHCRFNLRVVDQHGRRLAEGRDLELLQAELGVSPIEQVMAMDGKTFRVSYLERFALAVKEPLKALEKELHRQRDIGLNFTPFGGHEHLWAMISEATLSRVFLSQGLPDDDAAFDRALVSGKGRVLLIGQEVLRWLSTVLIEHSVIAKKINSVRSFTATHADITQHLSRLLPKDFIVSTPPERAVHLPRYLKAISTRMDKCRDDPPRDQRWQRDAMTVEMPFWRWASQQRGTWPDRFVEFRWLLEELRVALFAQELRTPMPVSVKRLEKSWQQLEK